VARHRRDGVVVTSRVVYSQKNITLHTVQENIHNIKALESHRKELRKHLTPAEAFLWKHLKNKQLEGRKFRRQHSIKNFIVDFYCPSERLVIELDGDVHMNYTAEEYGAWRQRQLENLGIKVLRFENKMVFQLLPSVLMDIRSYFR